MVVTVQIFDELVLLFGAAGLGMLFGWQGRPLFVRCYHAGLSILQRKPHAALHLWVLISRASLIALCCLAVMWVMDWPWVAILIAIPTTIAGVFAATPTPNGE